MDLAAGVEVRVVQHLAGVEHSAAGHARLPQHRHHLVLRAHARPRPDELVQRVAVLPARLRVLAAGVREQVPTTDGGRELAPHLLTHRLHVDVGIVVGSARRARVGAAGHAAHQLVASAPARLAVAVVIGVAAPEEIGHHLLHRYLDELALAGALALDVSGQDGGGGVNARSGVADGRAAADGLAVGEAGYAHHATRRLSDHVEALVLVVRAGEPEALDAGDDEARIRRAEPLVVEAQLFHQAGREILHDDVRSLDHPEEQRAATGILQIDRHAALVGIEDEEEHRVEARHLRPVAPRLLAARRLDLDDVGPEPAEELGAGRAGFELGEVEDPDAAQRAFGHGSLSPVGSTGSILRGITTRRNPMTVSQNDKAIRFRALHEAPGAFVIPNPWDAGSARILAALGFQALATSSGASAGVLGRRDGKVTRDEALAHARAIVAATELPVSADLEKGFGDAPEAAAGVKRISLATSLYRAAMTGLLDAAREVKDKGTFGYLDRAVSTPDLSGFMQG